MELRHEWKHEITQSDLLAIRSRLRAIASPDEHAGPNGCYSVRSLYFDTPDDRALREKLDGVNLREKFRLRCYNGSSKPVFLEKKIKLNGLCGKRSVELSADETRALLDGDVEWMRGGDTLLQELYYKLASELLRPRTIVEYTREPFVYSPGNVRVTIDTDIRTGILNADFLDSRSLTVPVAGSPVLLEVKYDGFLPDIIRDAVQLTGRRSSAFSKYAACRIYG